MISSNPNPTSPGFYSRNLRRAKVLPSDFRSTHLPDPLTRFLFSLMHHIGVVLFLLWAVSSFRCSHDPIIYLASLAYLYKVNQRLIMKLRRTTQFEKGSRANQRRALSDSERVWWLNHAAEKAWPIFMEQIASQKILMPIMTWFLDKYKPWTVSRAVLQQLYLGRNPPVFTGMRVLHQPAEDDHLVMEVGMNFLCADDMSTILAVQLNKRLAFGMWAKLHVTGMHIEGKVKGFDTLYPIKSMGLEMLLSGQVLFGMKFLRHWPFIGRLRLCFVEAPYFHMNVKPIINQGLDVTEIPGIAGWIDKILTDALEQTIIEPNMLVLDLEKFIPSPTDCEFFPDGKNPIAYVKLEIIEAADMKPSDSNDPYVKGKLGHHKFRTKTRKKTLAPKWQEEFKVPISTWELPNVLQLKVFDEDPFHDDPLGVCSIDIDNLRGGQRHDKWLSLRKIKMGRLHLAITVLDHGKEMEHPGDVELSQKEKHKISAASEAVQQDHNPATALKQDPKVESEYEPINISGHQKTGIWVYRPGSEVSPYWETRKREGRIPKLQIRREKNVHKDSHVKPQSNECSKNENPNGSSHPGKFRKALKKMALIFQRNSRNWIPNNMGEIVPNTTACANIRSIHKRIMSC
ncbi:hypothetical protein ACLOJK_010872 [Asimina triloba]